MKKVKKKYFKEEINTLKGKCINLKYVISL